MIKTIDHTLPSPVQLEPPNDRHCELLNNELSRLHFILQEMEKPSEKLQKWAVKRIEILQGELSQKWMIPK